MAEKKSLKEWFQELAIDGLVVGTIVPLMHALFDRLGKHVEKKAKKMVDSLGESTEEADESMADEDIFKSVVFHDQFAGYLDRMVEFMVWLRENNADLSKALMLSVAKQTDKLNRELGNDNGYRIAHLFLKKLIDIPGNVERVEYLKAWNMESLIYFKIPIPAIKSKGITDLWKEFEDESSELVKALEKELEKDPYRGFWTEALGFNPVPGFLTKKRQNPITLWKNRRVV